MFAVALLVFFQFDARYEAFLRSPRSEAIFAGLSQGMYRISDYADDPLVLWFWRSTANDPQADSLLLRSNLRRNFHISAVLRWEAREADDYETAMNKLNLASHIDSSAVENFLSLLSLAVRSRKVDPLMAALALPVLEDFRSQIFFIANGIVLVFLALFMSGFVYVASKTIHYLPVISHRIDLQEHGKLKGILGLAVLLFPVLVFRNLFLIFVSYAVLLIFVLGKRERNWLRGILLFVIVIFIFSLPLHDLMRFLSKESKSYRLYEMVHYDNTVTIDSDNEKDNIFEAYALKKRGDLEKAMSMYEEMYYIGRREIAVVNNLANIYFLYDEVAKAETLYSYTMRAGSKAEPFFNMGLLKLRSLEYNESSRYMSEARRRGFSSSSTEPLDIMPSNDEFYGVLLTEKLHLFDSIHPIFFFASLAIFVLTFLPFRFPPPFYCSTCGRAICRKCQEAEADEVICRQCFAKLKTTENVEVEQLLRHSVGNRRRRMKRMTAYLLNIIVPGAGLVYLNKNFSGLCAAYVVMLAYVPLLLPQFFIKPAGWVCLPLAPIFILVAIVVAFFAYVYTFLALRGVHGD
jgi:MFS family permease